MAFSPRASHCLAIVSSAQWRGSLFDETRPSGRHVPIGRDFMNRYLMTLLAGVAIGAIALQGLHAQGAKQKAYSVSEIEVLDASALAAYLPGARKAIEAAHGRTLRTADRRVVQIEGGPAPKRVGITEWDSVDAAVAFYKSKAWTDLAPQRDKATKVVRRYVVETEK
jgi:uncharacterized protein (DUF1330 family)